MKKSIILFTIIILSANSVFGQDCNKLLKDGEERYNTGKYEEAKQYFYKALEFNCPDAKEWVAKCDDGIKKQVAAVKATAAKAEKARAAAEAAAIAAKTETAAMVTAIYDARAQAQAEIDASEEATNKRNEIRSMIHANLDSNPTQSLDSGAKYKGETTGNIRNGLGVYLLSNGNIYFGKFENDNMNGQGVYMVEEGFQVRNCQYGVYYAGEFSDNNKSGMGYCYDTLGNLLYDGTFADDKPTSQYPIENEHYKFEIISYDNNGRYVGSTMDGQRNGLGVYLWDNGDMWFGNWENGQRDGYGIHISLDGPVTTGTWHGDNYSEK